MRICLCQLNPVVGDVDGNANLVLDGARRAREAGADVALFTEQVISGYPAEDLWLKSHFVDRCGEALDRIAPELPLPCIIGFPEREGDALYNAAAWVVDGTIAATYRKRHLPNYAVFDEHRWFTPGSNPLVVDVPVAGGDPVLLGLTIC